MADTVIRITAEDLAKEVLKAVKEELGGITSKLDDLRPTADKAGGGFSGMAMRVAEFTTGMVGAQLVLSGLHSAFTFVASATMGMNASLETSTLRFTTLMGDSDKAKEHVRDLFEIAKKTPFETEPIIQASLKLQTFGGTALNTKDNIILLGDAAAATGAPIDELGFWVGRLYSQLQGGQKFGEAAMRLQELAVMTPQARREMEAMQEAGASADEIFTKFKDNLGNFTGAMALQAGTWEGVVSTFTDTVNIMIADTFKPYFEVIRDLGAQLNGVLDGLSKNTDSVKGSVLATKNAFIEFIEQGLLGTVSATAFLMKEFYATKVVFGDVVQIISLVALGFKTASLAVAELLSLGNNVGPFRDDVKRIKEEMQGLTDSITARGKSLQEDKAAQAEWGKWAENAQEEIKKFTTNLKLHVQTTEDHTAAVKKTGEASANTHIETKKERTEREKLNDIMRESVSSMDTLSGAQIEAIRYYREQTTSVGDTAKILEVYEQQVRQVIAADKEDQAAKESIADSIARVAKETKNLSVTLSEFEELPVNQSRRIASILDGLEGYGKDKAKQLKDALGGPSTMQDIVSSLPSTILRSLEGGGDPLKAGGSLIGQTIGTHLQDSLTKTISNNFSGATGALLGGFASMLPAVGALAGPLVSKLISSFGVSQQEKEGRQVQADFQKQFGTFEQMMQGVGAAYEATGRSAAQARADVQALMDAERRGANAARAAVETINGAFREQQQDAQDLEAAIREYGFSIEELGPAMQRQKLGEQATTIMNQFRLLVGSGIAVGDVTDKMSDKINLYLQEVIKTGQEVPAAMRPMLEKMIENGEIVDENGNKITDLSAAGVNFAETMSGAADRIVKGFNDVLEKIGLIPAAANEAAGRIPRNPFQDWMPPGGYESPEYVGASTGGLVTTTGIEHFAGGGYNGGVDSIRAMLAPDEMVINPGQQRAISALMRNAPAAVSNAMEHKLEALGQTMRGLRNDFQSLPIMMRHALRGTR